MIINSNLAANNTIRQLGINEKATQSSLAKLSSGLRINSAADDAAGLSISEKMRGQISGLNQASSNAQTGINMISTAEGALNETTSILQRMRELAVQASNDSNTTTDRAAMQTETDQLISAINDIGNQTQFNTKNLLDGSLAGASGLSMGQNSTDGSIVGKLSAAIAVGASLSAGTLPAAEFAAETVNIDGSNITINWQNLSTADQNTIMAGVGSAASTTAQNDAVNLMINTINTAIDASGTNVAHVTGYVSGGKLNVMSGSTGLNSNITTVSGAAQVLNVVLSGTAAAKTTATGTDMYNGSLIANGTLFDFNINGVTMQAKTTIAISAGVSMASAATQLATIMSAAITIANSAAGAASSADAGWINPVTVNATTDGRFEILSQTGAASFTDIPGGNAAQSLGLTQGQTTGANGGGITFQVGANAAQTMSLSIGDMRSNSLGISGIDLSSTTTAQAAITTIDAATAKVSDQRSKLGAAQNRLEHTINNLGTSSQNITTAEANIRDVDMASEMTNFQKNNILQQAAQAMLAQANQQPQGVLQLLR